MENMLAPVPVSVALDAVMHEPAQPQTRSELVGERMLSLVAAYPRLRQAVLAAEKDFAPGDVELLRAMTDDGFGTVPAELQARADLINLRSGLFAGGNIAPEEELKRLMRELHMEALKKRQSELKLAIGRYEADGNDAGVAAALKEIDSVAKDLHTT